MALTVLLQPPSDGLMIGKGELSAAGAAVVYALSTIIAKPLLKHIPIGIFSVVRTGVGTVVFFAVAAYLYGPEHFKDVASPFLWQWMLVYGGIVVVGGQLAWFNLSAWEFTVAGKVHFWWANSHQKLPVVFDDSDRNQRRFVTHQPEISSNMRPGEPMAL